MIYDNIATNIFYYLILSIFDFSITHHGVAHKLMSPIVFRHFLLLNCQVFLVHT